MNLLEVMNEYKNCTDSKKAYVLLNMIQAMAKEAQDAIKPELEDGELGATNFTELGQIFSLIEMQKGSLDCEKVVSELTDEEIRSVFKPTEANLKTLGHKDLIEKYKTVTPVRQIRVTKIA